MATRKSSAKKAAKRPARKAARKRATRSDAGQVRPLTKSINDMSAIQRDLMRADTEESRKAAYDLEQVIKRLRGRDQRDDMPLDPGSR